jgi:predicted helicase
MSAPNQKSSRTDVFLAYWLKLRRTPVRDKTEHTDRGALEELLQFFATAANAKNLVQHEPGRQGDKGAPDFKITQSGQILGYVENKQIDDDLNKVAKSDQIARYLKLSGNLLLTDYLSFIWFRNGKIEKRATLGYSEDLPGKREPAEARMAEVSDLLSAFVSTAPEGIGQAQSLAVELAKRCRLLRDDLTIELVRQEKEKKGGRLIGLYQVFKDQVFHNLELKEFADAFAQTLGYGLFLAKFNVPPAQEITLDNVESHVPASFELIRELVDFLKVLRQPEYASIRWVVEEILSLINGLDLAALQEDLSFDRRKVRRGVRARSEEEARLFERDPYIYFYEDFLKAYDAETRESRGVYYTPPPVVSFIVRAIDGILKDSFGIKSGLADPKRVTVLDFACGTGTFLIEVFEQVFSTLGRDSGKTELVVRDHLLKNIYGFEYLIAPYTIAHLKLSQYLSDRQRPLKDGERVQVFLTNTLEPVNPQPNMLLPALSAEANGAQAIKDKQILVITGNPPYSGHSRNTGTWIRDQINKYKFVDSVPLADSTKWLNDDYVKFIRFAQWKMDAVDEGLVGIITNHSFLDSPTFRGMRRSLMQSFDQIYVLDLHGSSKKSETAPDGSKDENVFDILQGVCISILVKKPGLKKGVFHHDWFGRRLDKYKLAAETILSDLDWNSVDPIEPFYLFSPQDREFWSEYEAGVSLEAIFEQSSLGTLTKRDRLSIDFTFDELVKKLKRFGRDAEVSEIATEFDLKLKDQDSWDLVAAIQRVQEIDVSSIVQQQNFRPFDKRFIAYDDELVARRNVRVMRHLTDGNVGLVSVRQLAALPFCHVFATDVMSDQHFISTRTKEGGLVYPLYRTESSKHIFSSLAPKKVENISPAVRAQIDKHYSFTFEPEQIMGYIYSVLHCGVYRSKYAEFLKIDFPRITFCRHKKDFEALSALGWDLMQKHLLREVPDLKLGGIRGKGSYAVEKPVYADGRIQFNETQWFGDVPQDVWDFHIGGYQVLAKYLKDRKGRTLSLDEVENIENVVNVLAFTIKQMEKIDKAYAKAFC